MRPVVRIQHGLHAPPTQQGLGAAQSDALLQPQSSPMHLGPRFAVVQSKSDAHPHWPRQAPPYAELAQSEAVTHPHLCVLRQALPTLYVPTPQSSAVEQPHPLLPKHILP